MCTPVARGRWRLPRVSSRPTMTASGWHDISINPTYSCDRPIGLQIFVGVHSSDLRFSFWAVELEEIVAAVAATGGVDS